LLLLLLLFHQAELRHQPNQAIKEVLFHYPAILPACHCAKVHLEFLVRLRNHLSIKASQGTAVRAGEPGYGASPLSLAKAHLVRVVLHVIVWERLEKILAFLSMSLYPFGRMRLARPVYDNVIRMPLAKRIPILSIPCIVCSCFLGCCPLLTTP
jgi:hypothetical protein